MAKRKNNVNLDDIEKGYNIIKKYWKFQKKLRKKLRKILLY